MADNDLTLLFGADTAAVEEGADEVKAQVGGLAASIDALRAAFGGMGLAATEGFAKASEGAREASESVKVAAESITEFREAMAGIGEALIAAFAVEQLVEWSKHMGESGEQIEHMAARLGTSIGNVQQLSADFTMMGVNVDKGVGAIGRLDKAFAVAREGGQQQTAAFKELGVSISHNYDQMQLLGAVMDGFKEMANGPQKVAVAMQLLGRAGAEMIPFLNLGRAGMEELNRITSQYSVVAPEAAEKAAQLGSAWNENKVAMSGVSNVLAQAFAPAMTVAVQGVNSLIASWIRSYKAGGMVKTVVDFLVQAFKDLIDIVVTVGVFVDAAMKVAKGAVDGWKDDWQFVKDSVSGSIQDLERQFMALGRIIYDSLSGNTMQGAVDMQRYMRESSDAAQALGKKLRGDLTPSIQKIGDAWKSAERDAAAAHKFMADLAADKPHKQMDTTDNDGDTTGDPTKSKKAPKVAQGDDPVQALEQQLEAEKELQQNFWNEDLAGEIARWQKLLSILKAETGGTVEEQNKRASEIRQINTKIFTDEKALAEQSRQLAVDSAKRSTTAAEDAANAEYKATMDGLKLKAVAIKDAEQEGLISHRQALSEELDLTAVETHDTLQHLSEMADYTKAHYDALGILYANDNNKFADNLRQESDALAKIEAQKTLAVKQGEDARLAIQLANAKKYIDTVNSEVGLTVHTFTSGLLQMAEGQKSFGQVVAAVGQQMVEEFISRVIDRMITQWISGIIVRNTATAVGGQTQVALTASAAAQTRSINAMTNLKLISQDAAAAAAGAYKAMAGIPIIGPALGAAAAALTFGAVEAFGAMASAAGGYDIPAGVNPMTQLHAQEMVLPAHIANPLRSAISAGNVQPFAANGNSGGGDTHYHIHATDAQSFTKMLENSSGHLARLMKREIGNGALLKAGR